MNTPGKQNGVLSLKVNGAKVIFYPSIVFRTAEFPSITVSGLDVETFFGGSSSNYETPITQTASFMNFVLSYI